MAKPRTNPIGISPSQSVTKNYARIDGEDLFLDPKTPKSNRKITLPQFVCDMVKDYADKLYGYDPPDRLFEVTKHYLKHEMERGCKKTGLREIRVRDLRHSHASLLIELGFAPLLISERLGHESVTTTLEIYSHLYPTKHGEVTFSVFAIRNTLILHLLNLYISFQQYCLHQCQM